jgi:ATP-binding cassette, subfamily F, member 3
MIQFSKAGKTFGPRVLFLGVDWLITPNDRIGLVGANGTGKSTLLKVIGGLESLDYGEVQVQKGLQAGYLPQHGLSITGRTVFDECLSVFAQLQDIEREMEHLTRRMPELAPESPEYRQVADRFHHLESLFAAHDGYSIEAHVGSVLTGLGFPSSDWTRRTEEFSGGWQMRIALAKLLLEKPDVLLLDEPTNHLDLEARNWLEDYLSSYPKAFVLVSHDRYFLDVTIKKVVEIWNRQIHFYAGNYSNYVRLKEERLTQLKAAQRNQQEKIKQLEAFITRFRYQATKAKQVQSRIKELEKIERIEIPPEEAAIHFSFPQPKPSGRIVAEFRDVSKSYGDKLVFRGVNFTIERGDRIALVGVNGAGKSTLIKILAGTEPLSAGTYNLGHNVEPDYFAQDQYRELDSNVRMLDDLESLAPRSTTTELRSLLGCFLFSEDDVFKQIGVLSGGERNRYSLARLLLRPSNFLMLDEPTNHLDMRAKDVLLESLHEFTGTLVFVSHDRYFIDRLATRVFEVGGGSVTVYPGNYEDYLWRKQGSAGEYSPIAEAIETPAGPPANSAPPASPAAAEDVPAAFKPARRVNPIKVQQMRARVQEIEAEIARIEAQTADCEQALTLFRSADETIALTSQLDQFRQHLESLMGEWEALSLNLEDAGG